MISRDKQKSIFVWFTVTACVLGLFHYISVKYSFYWIFQHLDIFAHFLGGAVVALGARIFIYEFFPRLRKRTHNQLVILSVFIVGLLWEAMELFTGSTGVGKEVYVKDTLLDLIMDLIGGAVMLFI